MFHEMVCTQPLKALSSFQRMKVKQHSTATWPHCRAAPILPHAWGRGCAHPATCRAHARRSRTQLTFQRHTNIDMQAYAI